MGKLNVELRGHELTDAQRMVRRDYLMRRRLRRTTGQSVTHTYGENRHSQRVARVKGGITQLPDGRKLQLVSKRTERADGRCVGRRLVGQLADDKPKAKPNVVEQPRPTRKKALQTAISFLKGLRSPGLVRLVQP